MNTVIHLLYTHIYIYIILTADMCAFPDVVQYVRISRRKKNYKL